MESFGLFDFLKTLFPSPPENKGEEQENSAYTPSPEAAPQTNAPTEEPSERMHTSSQEAIAAFMQTHDERAKRLRR